MKIYGVPFSVHTRKVRLAAQLKAIPYELRVTIPVRPETLPLDWLSLSPTGHIPAIEDADFRLSDSTAIIHYLERKYPEPSLLPSDAHALGEAIFLDAWAGSLFRDVIHPIFHNEIVFPKIRKQAGNGLIIDAAMIRAHAMLGYLDKRARADVLVEPAITIGDLAVMSNLIMFHYLGRRIGPTLPKLEAYFRHHLNSDLVQAILPDEAPFAQQLGFDQSFII